MFIATILAYSKNIHFGSAGNCARERPARARGTIRPATLVATAPRVSALGVHPRWRERPRRSRESVPSAPRSVRGRERCEPRDSQVPRRAFASCSFPFPFPFVVVCFQYSTWLPRCQVRKGAGFLPPRVPYFILLMMSRIALFSGVSGFAKISSTLSQLIAFSNPNIVSLSFGVPPVYYIPTTLSSTDGAPAQRRV